MERQANPLLGRLALCERAPWQQQREGSISTAAIFGKGAAAQCTYKAARQSSAELEKECTGYTIRFIMKVGRMGSINFIMRIQMQIDGNVITSTLIVNLMVSPV